MYFKVLIKVIFDVVFENDSPYIKVRSHRSVVGSVLLTPAHSQNADGGTQADFKVEMLN